MSDQEQPTRPVLLTPLLVVTLAASVVLAVLGALDAARDPRGIGCGAPSPWAPRCSRPWWRCSLRPSPGRGEHCLRCATCCSFLSWPVRCAPWRSPSPCTLRRCTARSRRPGPPASKGFHYWFPSGTPLLGQTLGQTLGLTLLEGTGLGMLAGLAVVVVVTLPLLALVLTMIWQRPDRARRAAAGVPVGLDLAAGEVLLSRRRAAR